MRPTLLFIPSFLIPLYRIVQQFPLPQVPCCLGGMRQRANYLALHYWDRVDMTDSRTMSDNEDVMEVGFSEFISILSYASNAKEAFRRLYAKASACQQSFRFFVRLARKYLADTQSPFYDEELYRLALLGVLHQGEGAECSKNIDELLDISERKRLEFRTKLLGKNRVGQIAHDFNYQTKTEQTAELFSLQREYVLICFYDPECASSENVLDQLADSVKINEHLLGRRLDILCVNVEGDTPSWRERQLPEGWIDACDDNYSITANLLYDLSDLPSLYLLDDEKVVLLKNATVKQIESSLP